MISRRQGLSLIEMIVVMALFAVLSAIMAKSLWSTIRIERSDSAAFDQTVRRSALADQFREDVARSRRVLLKAGEYVTHTECLILDQGAKQIIYSVAKKTLVRHELTGADMASTHFPVGEDTRIELLLSGGLATLRFYDVRPRSEHRHPVQFMAALGGDLQ